MKDFVSVSKGVAFAIVDNTNTAVAVSSGSLPVFATPCMIALMEKATCNAADGILEENETSVGTKIDITHDKASSIGTLIKASATLTDIEGRKLCFDVKATEEDGTVIGKGKIERFVVDKDRFMKKVGKK